MKKPKITSKKSILYSFFGCSSGLETGTDLEKTNEERIDIIINRQLEDFQKNSEIINESIEEIRKIETAKKNYNSMQNEIRK